MKISELVLRLEEVQLAYGDIDVYIGEDDNTGCFIRETGTIKIEPEATDVQQKDACWIMVV